MDDRAAVAPDMPRVVVVAVAFFGLLALLGWHEGVFDRLEGEVRWALGLFAVAFAAATWFLDREVRDYVRRGVGLRKGRASSPAAKPRAT